VQSLINQPAFARGKSRNKHLALLGGLLYCESCATRMVYSYSGKNDRKYPYYVCLNAQRKGWAACSAKSLPARAIEESVLGQIREAQRGICDPGEWEQMDRTEQVEVIQAIVERIGYDGAARQISIRFHPAANMAAGQEVGA
jgi:Recombinase zinc beta ribbon domain